MYSMLEKDVIKPIVIIIIFLGIVYFMNYVGGLQMIWIPVCGIICIIAYSLADCHGLKDKIVADIDKLSKMSS